MSWRNDDDEDLHDVKNPCPCCDEELEIRRYYEDGYLVETNCHCSCGYNSNNSHGYTEIDYPEGYDEDGEKIVEEDEE